LAEDSGPKKPKVDRNSDEYKVDRARRYTRFRQTAIDTEKARKSYAIRQGFGERLLGAYGMGEEHFKKGGFIKGKLGMFAKAMDTAEAPLSDTPAPESERQKTNPNISTIIEQLETLLAVARKVGVVTADQVNDLKSHLSQKARDDEENRMESKDASAIPGVNGADFTQLNDEITTLIEKIKPLKEQIDKKVKEQEKERGPRGFMQRFAESYGVGDDYDRYSRRKASRKVRNAARTNPGYRRVMGRDGRVTYRGPSGRFANATDALVTPKPPSRLSRATSAIGRSATRVGGAGLSAAKSAGSGLLNVGRMGAGAAARGATRVAGSAIGAALNPSTIMRSITANRSTGRVAGAGLSAAGGVSKKISSILGGGIKKAGVAASATRNVSANVVKRIVKPIITKAIGSTVLKSIPIVGAVAGGLFAAKKLLEGDPVGAGLEAASGLAGPLTAIPAMVASVSRDAYSGIFNVQPEQDPSFPSRMKFILGIVGALVTAMLASKVEAKPAPTRNQIDAATVPPRPPQQMGESPSGTPTPAPPAAPAPSSTPSPTPTPPASSSSSSPAPSASASRSSSSSSTVVSTNENLSGVQAYMASSEFSSAVTAESIPTMVNPTPTTGVALDESSREVETVSNGPSVVDLSNGGRPLPSTSPPTKRGVSGAGDVPDPNYGIPVRIQAEIYS
jgi:hypothetical protein